MTPVHNGSDVSQVIATVNVDLPKSNLHSGWKLSRRVSADGAPNSQGELETDKYDYALLTLEHPVRRTQLGGRLGYWGHQGSSGFAYLRNLTPTVLENNEVFVAGYGGDTCVVEASRASNSKILKGSQLQASGQLKLIRVQVGKNRYVSRIVAHNVDTCGGQSGGPVWIKRRNVFDLVEVHTGGGKLNDGRTMNRAIRITKELIRQIRVWRKK